MVVNDCCMVPHDGMVCDERMLCCSWRVGVSCGSVLFDSLHKGSISLAYVCFGGSLNKECGRLHLIFVQGVQSLLRTPRFGAVFGLA